MLEALKSLFENNAISEEIRADIQEAWDKQVSENKLAVTAEPVSYTHLTLPTNREV